MIRTIMIVTAGLILGACSTSTYQIKAETDKILDTVPSWYMSDIKEKQACNVGSTKESADKQCLFGVGTSVSPDLNLAIEKAKMIAKAELADQIKGEMNKRSKQFITELGKSEVKTVVSDVESAIVNSIENTPVRGYEVFAQEVTSTKQGYYRAWVGLRLPLGEFNKMYNFTVNEVVDSYKLKEKADKAFSEMKPETKKVVQ